MSDENIKNARKLDEIYEEALDCLGLEQHISPNRRNGFFSMVGTIRSYAEAHK